MSSLATRLARQRALKERLRQRLAFEALVLERLERRAGSPRPEPKVGFATVLARARRRALGHP